MLPKLKPPPPCHVDPPSHLETPDRPSLEISLHRPQPWQSRRPPAQPQQNHVLHPSYRSPRHILPQNLIHRSLRITRIGLKPFHHLQIDLQPASNLTRRDPEHRILEKRLWQRRTLDSLTFCRESCHTRRAIPSKTRLFFLLPISLPLELSIQFQL
jgi:hypothetical protein